MERARGLGSPSDTFAVFSPGAKPHADLPDGQQKGPGALAGATEAGLEKELDGDLQEPEYPTEDDPATALMAAAWGWLEQIDPARIEPDGADALSVLFEALDEIDGDPDLEPSLGSINGGGGSYLLRNRFLPCSQVYWAGGDNTDLEDQCEGEGDDALEEGRGYWALKPVPMSQIRAMDRAFRARHGLAGAKVVPFGRGARS